MLVELQELRLLGFLSPQLWEYAAHSDKLDHSGENGKLFVLNCGRLLLRLRPPAFEIVPSPDFKMSIFRCGVASKARHATSSQNHRSFKFLLWQVCADQVN